MGLWETEYSADTRNLIFFPFLRLVILFPSLLPILFSCTLFSPYILLHHSSYIQLSLCIPRLSPLHVGPVPPGFLRGYPADELFRKMSKAGPLTRSVLEYVRPAGSPAHNNHANAPQMSSNAQIPQPRERLRRRLHSDEIVIGLALGSPGQSPLPALPPDDHDVDVSYVCSSPENPTSTLANVCEMGSGSKGIKRKGSKWKSLGSFFGRRDVRSASPFYQLDQKQQPEPANEFITRDYSETNALRRKRADSNHGKKAHQVDSSTGVPGEEGSALLRRNSSRRRGLRRRKVEEPQPEVQRIPVEYTAHAIAENLDPRGEQQGSRMPGSSLLQVEIPCVEMERYSVMFGDVLEPQVRQSKTQPSLLARRQGHLEELHTVADSDSEVRSSAIEKQNALAEQFLIAF